MGTVKISKAFRVSQFENNLVRTVWVVQYAIEGKFCFNFIIMINPKDPFG